MSLGLPKPRPRLLDKREAKADVERLDREQKAICRTRSGGRCEVWYVLDDQPNYVCYVGTAKALVLREREYVERVMTRCHRRASENHHLIGGIGRRNRGRSIMAAHRLHVCARCHEEITGKVLVPCVEQAKAECAATVRYERKR